ncbi:MAG: PIG-L family deacetylase [Thermoguttaceae bacterium]|jgi:LmbE family N-acetylglucosaminyl deacetylase|nr:PIG-L family deacetylase [Thermoguttaceae bacterium]
MNRLSRSILGTVVGLAWAAVAVVALAAEPAKAPPEAQRPSDGKVRVIVFGAHPDDCEIRAGGVGALWAAQGHHVQFVSTTNGDIGHSRIYGAELAARRKAEALAADKHLGVATKILDIHDGELEPTLEYRRQITRAIRQWAADVVIAHRPNDYHPDHRYTGVLVQDSAYMVTVPFFCPETPYLRGNPVFLYSEDGFERPNPFRPDIVVAIDEVIDRKVEALVMMESQFVEGGANGPYPKDDAERKVRAERAARGFRARSENTANRFRAKLIELYGEEQGKEIRYAEAFEICEYGRRPNAEEIRRLFPFFPKK